MILPLILLHIFFCIHLLIAQLFFSNLFVNEKHFPTYTNAQKTSFLFLTFLRLNIINKSRLFLRRSLSKKKKANDVYAPTLLPSLIREIKIYGSDHNSRLLSFRSVSNSKIRPTAFKSTALFNSFRPAPTNRAPS